MSETDGSAVCTLYVPVRIQSGYVVDGSQAALRLRPANKPTVLLRHSPPRMSVRDEKSRKMA